MKKQNFVQFINLVSIDGLIDSASIRIEENSFKSGVRTPSKSMGAEFQMNGFQNDFNHKNFDLPIVYLPGFKSSLSIFDEEFDISFTENPSKSIIMKDKEIEITYPLGEGLFPKFNGLKRTPKWDIIIQFDKMNIEKMVKFGKIKEGSNTIQFNLNEKNHHIVFHNWNSESYIQWDIRCLFKEIIPDNQRPISFDMKYMSKIFKSNLPIDEIEIKISYEGLMSIQTEGKNYKAKYFLCEVAN